MCWHDFPDLQGVELRVFREFRAVDLWLWHLHFHRLHLRVVIVTTDQLDRAHCGSHRGTLVPLQNPLRPALSAAVGVDQAVAPFEDLELFGFHLGLVVVGLDGVVVFACDVEPRERPHHLRHGARALGPRGLGARGNPSAGSPRGPLGLLQNFLDAFPAATMHENRHVSGDFTSTNYVVAVLRLETKLLRMISVPNAASAPPP